MATMTGALFAGARCCARPRVQDLLSSSRILQGRNAVNCKFKARETSFRTGLGGLERRQVSSSVRAGSIEVSASADKNSATVVVVTQEQEKNGKLMNALSARGNKCLEIPLIEHKEGADYPKLAQTLRETEFQSTVVTSSEAATVFPSGWRAAGCPKVRVAIVGSGTGEVFDAIKDDGDRINLAFTPYNATAKVLAVELPNREGGNGEILCPSSAKAGSDLGMSTLKEIDGCNVAEAQQQHLRNSILRIGMVMACPVVVTAASSVLEDYCSSAVAIETSNISAIPAAMSNHWSSSFTFELLHRVGVLLADLDPATAKLAITILGPFFAFFNVLFIFRIVMSWYPQIPVSKFPFVLAYAPTEPILGPTRRLIPPVGGVDVAPVIWVALMSFLNEILLGKQGLFILLSQQQ